MLHQSREALLQIISHPKRLRLAFHQLPRQLLRPVHHQTRKALLQFPIKRTDRGSVRFIEYAEECALDFSIGRLLLSFSVALLAYLKGEDLYSTRRKFHMVTDVSLSFKE